MAMFARTLNSLQLTLLISVALPLVLLSALATRFGLAELNASREQSLKGDLALVARAIYGPVSEALRQDSRVGLEASLDSVFSLGRVYGASVYDDEGRRIAAAGATERDMTDSRITRRLSRSGEMQEDYREIDGEDVFSHFLPLFDEHGQANGFIQLSRRETDFQIALRQLTWAVWAGWVGVAFAIIAVVLVGHYRSVGRHLRTLVAGLPRIAGGDFERRFLVQGPQEVRELSRGLNSMLTRLAEREQELALQRREEQSLQRRLADAERLATVGRLARGFAHELGAPLSVIEGRARRIARRAP
jgi:methyl-accepting chemotaxis protein